MDSGVPNGDYYTPWVWLRNVNPREIDEFRREFHLSTASLLQD